MQDEDLPEGLKVAPAVGAALAQQRTQVLLGVIDGGVKLGSQAIKWGVIGFLGYLAAQVLQAMAGEETGLFLDLFANKWFSYLVMALCGVVPSGGWLIERKLRKRDVERLTQRPHSLELVLDSKRTSTGLLTSGDNPPGDGP